MQTSRTFSIHFWINPAKEKKNLSPIYARITVDGKRAELSLKRSISVTYWDSKTKRSKSRTDEGKALNQYLDRVYAKLLDCHKQLIEESKHISARAIKERFLGEDERHKTLMDLVTYHNQNMKSILKPGTLKNYYTTERYIQRFLRNKLRTNDIYLTQLSYNFIIDFEQFLRNGKSINDAQPLKNNGVMKHLERLKKMTKLALRLEWIEKDPFIRYSLKFKKHERSFLNEFELKCIEDAELNKPKHQIARDMFIFACYTGLSYIDVKKLTEDNIVRGIDGNYWIYSKREKTDENLKVPILDKAFEILKKYERLLPKKDYLLPIYSNQKTNDSLKEIAAELKIRKKLSFHVARHTFATTITLSNGVPIETVSKLLGHTKLATTQIYAKVLEQKLSSDMSILRNKLNSIRGNVENINKAEY
ncbi:site-specific recombinase XerD [Christiangramia gaetbulicola]|uniref:Site-specific recombinase XerD n=1 Tax=Christiangramia gaetbulicola TaxID=703340 RepID=A0A2T6AIJ0_9FLAO|nr:site-specific integrase [Christiangramia gaetbulicola]PTX43612.1 site-specific recombinase XerD [Christiangramia gaetbulicola]